MPPCCPTWDEYLCTYLLNPAYKCVPTLKGAAILGCDEILAEHNTCATYEEMSYILRGMCDPCCCPFKDGIRFGGKLYQFLSGDSNIVRAKTRDKCEGLIVVRATYLTLFGIYQDPVSVGEVAYVLEKQADYLKRSGL